MVILDVAISTPKTAEMNPDQDDTVSNLAFEASTRPVLTVGVQRLDVSAQSSEIEDILLANRPRDFRGLTNVEMFSCIGQRECSSGR